jgi:hypothetical protein
VTTPGEGIPLTSLAQGLHQGWAMLSPLFPSPPRQAGRAETSHNDARGRLREGVAGDSRPRSKIQPAVSLFGGGASMSASGKPRHHAGAFRLDISTTPPPLLGNGRGLPPATATPHLTSHPSLPRPADRKVSNRSTATPMKRSRGHLFQSRPPWSGKGGETTRCSTLHLQMSPPTIGDSRSRPQGSRSRQTPPFPPPWRDREGGACSHLLATGPGLAGLFRELGRDPSLAAAHHGRQRGREARRPPAPPVGAGVQLGRGRLPKPWRKPNLRVVQGGPADPLPVTPASGAAGGGGEGGRRVNATARLSREGERGEGKETQCCPHKIF